MESFNNVPNILEKARQAVDEVTQAAPEPKGAAKPAEPGKPKAVSPKKPKAALSKKSAKVTVKTKKTATPAASPSKPATTAAPPPPETLQEPLLGLPYYGISVKHAILGRIRLRLPRMLHNETLAQKLPALLTAVPGITGTEASAATGSLLIIFDSRKLAGAQSRQGLAGVMRQFFPRLDTESLVERMLHA
jgi:hypothetical protein